jgi:competence protein ComEC
VRRVRAGQLLLVAISMTYGAGLVLAPLLTTCVALCAWLLFWGVTAAPARLLALLLGLLTAWRAQHQTNDYLAQRQQWIAAHGARANCSGQGVILTSPTVRRGSVVTIIETDSLDCDSPSPTERVRLRLVSQDPPLARGDRVAFVAEVGPVSIIQNLDLMSPIPRAVETGVLASGAASQVELLAPGRGLTATIDRSRNHVRSRIMATYSPKAEALGRALVLGENDLDPDDDAAFRRSGLSHLLAVSGTHLVFAIVAWMTALKGLLLRITVVSSRCDVERLISPLGAVSAMLYADFAGGSGSAWRAAWMLAALYGGRLLARRVSGVQALALSLVAGAVVDQWLGFDISFLLSAAATLGLISLGQRVAPLVRSVPTKPLRLVCLAATTTICAMLPCVPILSLMSPDVTVAGVFANVIAGPLGEAASLPLCLVHAVVGLFPAAERGLALCASGSLLLVAQIAKLTAGLQWARVAIPYLSGAQFCVLLLTALAVASGSNRHARGALTALGVLAFVLVEFATRSHGSPRNRLRITVNDVGQGDSLLVDFPDGRCMLVDGGGSITGGSDPGLTVLQPLLRARRRKRLDVVVITHPHPDHFGGLLSLLPTVEVGEVWMQEGTLAELGKQMLQRHIPVMSLRSICQRPRHFGAAEVRVLGPCPDASSATNVNNASIVMQLRMGDRVAILPGDAEHEAEHHLVQLFRSELKSDFLKVGHHGSRSSTSQEWLRAVHPRWAAISVGSRNRFGHPVPATEKRLLENGAVVLRTDELGSIQWETDGKNVSLRTSRSKVATDGSTSDTK